MMKQGSGSGKVVVAGRETDDGVGARKMRALEQSLFLIGGVDGASFEDFNLARLIGRFPVDASAVSMDVLVRFFR